MWLIKVLPCEDFENEEHELAFCSNSQAEQSSSQHDLPDALVPGSVSLTSMAVDVSCEMEKGERAVAMATDGNEMKQQKTQHGENEATHFVCFFMPHMCVSVQMCIHSGLLSYTVLPKMC